MRRQSEQYDESIAHSDDSGIRGDKVPNAVHWLMPDFFAKIMAWTVKHIDANGEGGEEPSHNF